MNHARDRRDVSQLVQTIPPPTAQTFDHLVGRSDRQRNQDEKREHPEKDERPLERVFDDGAELERLVEPRVSQQVQAAVEEREQTERPPELDQPRQSQRLPERRDGQRETHEDQRQRSSRVKNELL